MPYWVIWNIFPDGYGGKKKRLLPEAYADEKMAIQARIRLNAGEKCVPAKYRQSYAVTPEPMDKVDRFGRIIIRRDR